MPLVHSGHFKLSSALLLAAIFGLFVLTRPACAQSPAIKIVAFGDSLTAGYGLPASAAFPVVLEKALRESGEKVAVDNAGVSGDTSTDGLARLDWSIGEDIDAVILELGANDMLRGVAPSITRTALDQIMTALQKRKIKVLIAGMVAAPGMGQAYSAEFNSIYSGLAQKYGALLYPFFLNGIAGNANLLLGDGMHPNRSGVERIVEGILPSVVELIARTRAAKEAQR